MVLCSEDRLRPRFCGQTSPCPLASVIALSSTRREALPVFQQIRRMFEDQQQCCQDRVSTGIPMVSKAGSRCVTSAARPRVGRKFSGLHSTLPLEKSTQRASEDIPPRPEPWSPSPPRRHDTRCREAALVPLLLQKGWLAGPDQVCANSRSRSSNPKGKNPMLGQRHRSRQNQLGRAQGNHPAQTSRKCHLEFAKHNCLRTADCGAWSSNRGFHTLRWRVACPLGA